MRLIDGARARLRLLFSPTAAESRMEEEIGFHIDMETERLMRDEGLEEREARRRAIVSFGGVERTKEELRSGRGLGWLSGLRLDIKLGARMLVKHPVLTAASVLALAIAVAMAASWFQFMGNILYPKLRIPGGDRVVQFRNVDLRTASTEPRSLHDFETWRTELSSVEELSAGTSRTYTITTEAGRFESLEGMAVTPAMFRLGSVQPMLGRAISEADTRPGADPVIVLGHSAWERLFDGDRAAVGETVRVGSGYATLVGVMPPGYGFPVNEEAWTPLRERAVDHARLEGPPIAMFGRLAPGASVEEARAELEVIGQRTTAEFPTTHERLRPEIVRYGRGSDMRGPAAFMNLPLLLFLIVVSANVATLLFARTASRESEIAMRSALGASRRRLILQLVAESLVLTLTAAALGLAVAHWGMGWGMEVFWQVQQETPPFWFDAGISLASVLYVLALAVLGAFIIGGIPGLRATRRQLRTSLVQPGGGGPRFGAIATGVIIVQVALCVAFIPMAIMVAYDPLSDEAASEFPAERFLSGRVVHETPPPAGAETPEARELALRRTALFDEVQRRLAAEAGVVAATRASMIPGMNHPMSAIEVEADSTLTVEARRVAVDPNYFEVVGARVINGRDFRPEDVTGDQNVVIVDQEWAQEVFGGENAIGRRIRFPFRDEGEATPWHEVIGVVAGADAAVGPGNFVAVYQPLRSGEQSGGFVSCPACAAGVQFYLRTDGPPEAIMPQVHGVVTAVDPGFMLTSIAPLDDIWRPVERSEAFFETAIAVVAAIILLFALMGIYALMSFTVAHRAREIGIRAALGAEPRRIVAAIFSRAMTQIGLGVVAGALLVSLTIYQSPDELRMVAGVAVAMVLVGLLGCVLPAMRALRIHPTEALRAE